MPEDLASRLNRVAGGSDKKDLPPARKLREFEDQTVTLVSIKSFPSKFKPSEKAVLATILDADATESAVWLTPTAGRQAIEVESHLPLDVKVLGFDTSYGNRGYKLELS